MGLAARAERAVGRVAPDHLCAATPTLPVARPAPRPIVRIADRFHFHLARYPACGSVMCDVVCEPAHHSTSATLIMYWLGATVVAVGSLKWDWPVNFTLSATMMLGTGSVMVPPEKLSS